MNHLMAEHSARVLPHRNSGVMTPSGLEAVGAVAPAIGGEVQRLARPQRLALGAVAVCHAPRTLGLVVQVGDEAETQFERVESLCGRLSMVLVHVPYTRRIAARCPVHRLVEGVLSGAMSKID
jgi:hypothetical protein